MNKNENINSIDNIMGDSKANIFLILNDLKNQLCSDELYKTIENDLFKKYNKDKV